MNFHRGYICGEGQGASLPQINTQEYDDSSQVIAEVLLQPLEQENSLDNDDIRLMHYDLIS